jgi:uncharacterized protein involved in exopolysaccharide biosynthesis
VVDVIGPKNIVPGPLPADAAAQREEAFTALRLNLTIAAAQDSGEITVRATTSRPELARQIAATLVETYLQDNERKTPAPVALPDPPAPELVAEEQIALENAWKTASAHLRQMQEPQGDLSLAGRRKLIEDQLAAVEVQLVSELSKQEAEERRLANKLTPAHPQLVALRELIDDLSKWIDAAEAPTGDSAAPAKPTENRLPGAVGLLCTRRQVLQRELADLNRQEGRVAQAAHEVELASLRLQAQGQRREVAPAPKTPQPGHSIEISIAQAASPARLAAGFPPLWTIAVGAALGVFGGIGVALVCYQDNPLLMTRREVEAELELTVSGPVPTADTLLDVAA